MLCFSYYCLYSLSDKIRDKGRQFLPESMGLAREKEGCGRGKVGAGGKGKK
jgi:hypothetical protein